MIKQIGGWVRWPSEPFHALKTWRGIADMDGTGPISLSPDERTWCGVVIPTHEEKQEASPPIQVTGEKVEVMRGYERPKGDVCERCLEALK